MAPPWLITEPLSLSTKSCLCFRPCHGIESISNNSNNKGESRHKNWCMARVLSFLIRYFSNYYTLHRSDLAARAAPLDPRLNTISYKDIFNNNNKIENTKTNIIIGSTSHWLMTTTIFLLICDWLIDWFHWNTNKQTKHMHN